VCISEDKLSKKKLQRFKTPENPRTLAGTRKQHNIGHRKLGLI
jgi:hypothetical protein